jgi:hypothetical protein
VGYDCPTKLYYQGDKTFGNNNLDNSFLEALAEGGFQVAELAKLYHPGGTEVTDKDKKSAADMTSELLKKPNVVIYEAAFLFENLFVKTDILVKRGEVIELIEVKAKSFDPTEEEPFYNKNSLKKGKPKFSSAWESYLVDIAFQTHVFKKAHPKFKINSFLMLANKTAVATVSGINQKFFLEKDGSQVKVKIEEGITEKDLGEKLLVKVPVNSEIKRVWKMTFENGMMFDQMVSHLSSICENHIFIKPVVGVHCKSCEFKISSEIQNKGFKSGFENCWSHSLGMKSQDFDKPMVFEIWNFRKTSKLIDNGKFFITDLEEEDVSPTPKKDEPGLSSSERQWIQVEKIKKKDKTPYFDHVGLSKEMKTWKFPLHFIDFETTMVAIPFHKGRRPYEQIAFQFSHHVVNKDGTIVHKNEYINREKGYFLNFDFVRALMKALSGDSGTIFRFATHENTVLCQIREQLLNTLEEVPDRSDLVTFIESITTFDGRNSSKSWDGDRTMVDMCELVKKYYYHPAMKGSNSIKKVLPAILNESKYLQKRYSKAIYGRGSEVESINYKDWKWIEWDATGKVIDPYKRLPPIFSDLDLEIMNSLVTEDHIADGGAAMTAYARIQFTQMSQEELDRVVQALLKYCELDTFAMVMIWEYWNHEIVLKKSV